ncbi:MAG: glycine cleavage system protein R [Actinomycetota bacterium]
METEVAESMNLVAVTVIGNDRPGIVAGVSKALFDAGCNLEDVSSTILRGHFSMVLLVETPDEVDPGDVDEHLRSVGEELDLTILIEPVEATDADVTPPTHMVSVYGADRPGIVAHVTDLLAAYGANITDLTSRVVGGADDPVYALMLEVTVPAGVDLEKAVSGLREELGVDASVHPIDADVL